MSDKQIFEAYEEKIPQTAEVASKEENFGEVFKEIAAYNKELAFRVDSIVGALTRAYEAQGFSGGMAAARGAL